MSILKKVELLVYAYNSLKQENADLKQKYADALANEKASEGAIAQAQAEAEAAKAAVAPLQAEAQADQEEHAKALALIDSVLSVPEQIQPADEPNVEAGTTPTE